LDPELRVSGNSLECVGVYDLCLVLGVWVLGSGVCDLGSGVWVQGFGVWSLGFGVGNAAALTLRAATPPSRERESVCLCVRDRVCVCLCVCEREVAPSCGRPSTQRLSALPAAPPAQGFKLLSINHYQSLSLTENIKLTVLWGSLLSSNSSMNELCEMKLVLLQEHVFPRLSRQVMRYWGTDSANPEPPNPNIAHSTLNPAKDPAQARLGRDVLPSKIFPQWK